MTHNILNLTPHDINIYQSNGFPDITFPKSDRVLLGITKPQTHILNLPKTGIPIFTPQDFETLSVPPIEDKYDGILVSMPVGQWIRNASVRKLQELGLSNLKIYGPDFGPDAAIRDSDGQPCGTKRLVLYFSINWCEIFFKQFNGT